MNYCLGTVQFGLNYGIQGNAQPREDNIFEMLACAIDNGIEVFDTATAYGEAEEVLGHYFSCFPDKITKVSVISKLRPDAFVEINPEQWGEIAVQNASESLKRLGINKFEAYLFHNASYIFDNRAVQALYSVKEADMTESIGVSVYSPEEAMKALEHSQIDVIQIPYNLFDHRLDKCDFFAKAKAQGVVVYARSSLLQGLIMMDPNNLPKKVAFAKNHLVKLHSICDRYNVSLLQAAVGYVGSKQGIDYVVFGVDSIDQLKEYISLRNDSLPEEMMTTMETAFDEVEEKLVNPVLWR